MESKNIGKVKEIDIARKMVGLGYRWQVSFNSANIKPLYTKTCGTIGSLLRDYPENSGDVTILPIRIILG